MEDAAWKALQAKQSPFDLAAPPSKHYILGTRSLETLLIAVQQMRGVAMKQIGSAQHYHKPKTETYTENQLRQIQKASGFQASDHMLLKLNKFMHTHIADFELMTRRDSEKEAREQSKDSTLVIPVPLNVGGSKCEVMSGTLLGETDFHSQFFREIMFLTPSALAIEGGTVALSSDRGARIFQAMKMGNCVGADAEGNRYFETVPRRADKHYFVDRSGELFEYVLAFMRDKVLLDPPGGLSDNLLARLRLEAEYFQIPEMSTAVNTILKMRNLGLEKDAMAELVQKNKFKMAELLDGHQSAMKTMHGAHMGEIENARTDVEKYKLVAKEAELKVHDLKKDYEARMKKGGSDKADDDAKRRGSRRSIASGSTSGENAAVAAAATAAAVEHATQCYKELGQRYSSDTAGRWAVVAKAVSNGKPLAAKLPPNQLVEFAAELLTAKTRSDATNEFQKPAVMSEFLEEFVYGKYSPTKARSFLQSVHISLADAWTAPTPGDAATGGRPVMVKVLAMMLGIVGEGHPTLGPSSHWHSDYMPEVAVEFVTRSLLPEDKSKLEDEATWQQLNQDLGGAKKCTVSRSKMLAALAGDEKTAGMKRDTWTGRFVTFLRTQEMVDGFIAAADEQLTWTDGSTSIDELLLLALEHTAAEATRRYDELVELFTSTVSGGELGKSLEQQTTWAWEVDRRECMAVLGKCSIGIGRSFFSKSAEQSIDAASPTACRAFRELCILVDEKDCVTTAVFAAFCHRQEIYPLGQPDNKVPPTPAKSKGK
jgi:hypothetical protein